MARVTRVVTVKAAPRQVIEYICNVSNHPAFIPSLTAVENIHGDPRQPGTTWDWTFVMAGLQIRGRAETVLAREGECFSFKTSAGIESTFTYTAAPADGATRLTLDVAYEVPATVLAKALDRTVVERMNEAEADQVVKNIRTIFGS
jgi:ribosome-associated toxin RatA of RatAB toxin-antitoxin module